MNPQNDRILTTVAFGLGLGLALVAPAFAQTSTSERKTETCNVEFKSGVLLEEENAAQDCVTRFEKLNLSRIEIVGYASPGGSEATNRALSQRRADMVSEKMKQAFPDLEISARGAGVDSRRGRSALVLAYYSGVQGTAQANPVDSITSRPTDQEDARNGSDPMAPVNNQGRSTDMTESTTGAASDTGTPLQREDIPSGWNDVRIAGRVGYDRQWDRDEYMNSAGIDASYVRRNLGTRLARLEAGATASFLGDPAEDLKAFNFHGTVFPALEAGPLVFGPRGLLGGSWEDQGKETVIDAGGEGRIGVEAANYSIFMAAGRTTNLTRIGLDVGATF